MIKHCVVCGEPFKAKTSGLFCGETCRVIQRKALKKAKEKRLRAVNQKIRDDTAALNKMRRVR